MCDKVLLHERCIALQLERESPPALQRARPQPQHPNYRPQQVQQVYPEASALPPIPPHCSLPPKPQPTPRRSSKFLQFQYGSLNRHNIHKDPQLLAAQTLSKSTDGLNSDIVQEQDVHKTGKPTAGHGFRKSPVKFPVGNTGPLNLNSPPGKTQDPVKNVTTPPYGNSSSTSSGTPTPTNPLIPHPICPTSPNRVASQGPLNNYQEGLLLFQSWVAANAACVWDDELVRAVKASHFVGILVGGYLLVGGTSRVLAAICHAHSRALLSPPPGWNILLLGEIRDCEVSVVARGQFTPLGDALCWVIHRLANMGIVAEQDCLRSALLSNFPAMTPPDHALVHATLSDLIRRRKVFHTARGYGIVQPDTYVPVPAPLPETKPPAPRLLTTSEALTRAHGTEEIEKVGWVCHAAVQTDLADLLSGIWPGSTILSPRPQNGAHGDLLFPRSGSFRNAPKRLSLLSPEDGTSGKPKIRQYEGYDLTDVTHRGGDKASMLSKLLRVSQPRRRLASFSAQFPPPEWGSTSSPAKHLHSVATQTRSSKHPGGPESCWMRNAFWAPRSSTLPRRPPKPLSTSPVPQENVPYRPHSASPSRSKMASHDSYSSGQYSPHRTTQQFSSSPSPSGTPSQSSRNPSPSIQSSSASPDTGVGQRYYHRSTSSNPAFKRGSPTPQPPHPKGHTALASRGQHKNHQQASFHSSLGRDPRRKPLSLVNQGRGIEGDPGHQEKEPEGILVDHRSQNRGQGRQNSPRRQLPSTAAVDSSSTNSQRGKPNQKQVDEKELDREQDPDTKTVNGRRAKNDRQSLQLDLSTVHMNNSRKVVSSPTKPDGLKKVFHENLSSIAKGSLSDLTSKNLGYTDVDKCDKKLCVIGSSMMELDTDNRISKDEEEDEPSPKAVLSKSSPSLDEKPLKSFRPIKLSLSIAPDKSIDDTDLKKDLDYGKPISPDEEIHSVKTYPSLSELNLNFSSLTAQKILQGVSVNSIDTLVEVNMLADKSLKEGVTNTNFGFV